MITGAILQAVEGVKRGCSEAFDLLVILLEDDIDGKARSSWVPGYDTEDVKQELLLALHEAAMRFDVSMGHAFRTFFWHVAKLRITDLQRYTGRGKRKGENDVIHYDGLTEDADGTPDFFGSYEECYDDLEMFTDLAGVTTLREQFVIRMKMEGYDNITINSMIGGTVYHKANGAYNGCEVDRILRSLRKKCAFLSNAS